MDTDEGVYTVDLGFSQVVFNGPVAKDDRVLLAFTAMKDYCYACTGNGNDDRHKLTQGIPDGLS